MMAAVRLGAAMVVVTGESLLGADGGHSHGSGNERESDGNERKQSFHGCTSPNVSTK
jgi:hypothetical protein